MPVYNPPQGDAVEIKLGPKLVFPGDAVVLELATQDGPGPVEGTPKTPDTDIPWGEMEEVGRLLGAGWKLRKFVTRSFSTAHQTLSVIEGSTRIGWHENSAIDRSKTTSWEALDAVESSSRVKWRSRKAGDRSGAFAWGVVTPIEISTRIKRGNATPKDYRRRIIFNDLEAIDHKKRIIYVGKLPVKDLNHRSAWGKEYYNEICWRTYQPKPNFELNFDFHVPLTHTGDKWNTDFYFDKLTFDRRCKWREPSGWRDAYFYDGNVTYIPTGPNLKVYIMHNQAFLTRLPDRAAIDASSITISTDWDSVYWTLRAAIGNDAHLGLLEPTADGPIAVEVMINDFIWKMQVDRTSYGRAFTGKTRAIEGRSISAQLGAPAAELKTYIETEARNAAQLIDRELENTGWSADFDIEDWLVPANSFSYQSQSPMSVIKTIADAAGAMVQTHMNTQTINILPRYKSKPWTWSTVAPDLIIPSSMIEKMDHEWDERPFYNSAFVSGGISAKVSRAESAGDKTADMVQDPLITAVEAARQRAFSIICGSGRWSKYRIDLPVFRTPTVPGVILPGTIIKVVDGLISFAGVVTAVSVTANRGRDGLKVRQTIDFERYRGN